MTAPLRVLCLDIEGGFGGSSRSLYESVSNMDRSGVEIEVWCRRDGPARAQYEMLGIPCRIIPGLPKMNSLRSLTRNIFGYAIWLRDFLKWRQRYQLVQNLRERFDLIHFNHEGLFGLAWWLRRKHGKAQTMHVRTLLLDNAFGRCQARAMTKANDRLVFITENERKNLERLAGAASAGVVIYNIVSKPPSEIAPHQAIPRDKRLKIAVLSNYSYMRGIDRVVDIAAELSARGRRDVLFVVAGDMRLRGSLPGDLGRIAKANGTLADYATSRGVADMTMFLGHVTQPESVLAGCDLLIKPTRENNPWGRDILEGLAAGKPVISVGQYSRFVENGVTGFLFSRYDSAAIADAILQLDSDRDMCRQVGVNAMRRVAELCDGASRAQDLLKVWQQAVENRSQGEPRRHG